MLELFLFLCSLLGGITDSKKPSKHEYREVKNRIGADAAYREVQRMIELLSPSEKHQLRQKIQGLLVSKDAVRQILKSNPSYRNLSEHDVSASLRALLLLLSLEE